MMIQLPIDSVYPVMGVMLMLGLLLGYLAKLVRLPSVTGYIVAGLLLGPIFGIVNTHLPRLEMQLEPITNLALSLIAISIGSHLQFGMLRGAIKRILALGAVGTLIVPLVVFLAILITLAIGPYRHGEIFYAAVFMGILAVATAPATVVHVVKESQARGVFVKTLIAVVVLNNVSNIFLFEGARAWIEAGDVGSKTIAFIIRFGGALGLGALLAGAMAIAWRHVHSRQKSVTLSFAALIVAYGLALQLDLSPVLTTLALGITIANLPGRNHIVDIFEDYEVIVYALFFTLMGTHARFDNIGSIGLLAGVFFAMRVLANLGTVYVSGRLTHLPKRVSKYLGLALTPQAGITVALAVSLESMSIPLGTTIASAVLLSVAFSEIVGPLVLRFSLRKSGEEGQALPRLIDFLQEETITVDLKATEKTEVIEELVAFLFKSNPALRKKSRRVFLESVLHRELESSTGVGMGVAIPHGVLEGGHRICGVMAVSREGLNWDSHDGQPVHMVILVATPPGHQEQHLGALAAISELFRRRSVTSRQLHLAKTPADVYEVLVDEEFQSLNEVVEDALTPTPRPDTAAEPAEG